MSKSILAVVFVSILSFSANAVSAQCSKLANKQERLLGTASAGAPDPEGTMYKVPLPANTRFIVSLDSDLSSANTKENDLVQFSVASDVYALYPNEAAAEKLCVVIPKDTKIYGLVDFARSRYPFYIGGKAKLYVYLQSMQIRPGELISLDFAEPIREHLAVSNQNRKDSLRDCKKNEGRKCITGRRAKLTFSPTIVAVGAGTAATLVKDDTTKALALLGLVQNLGNLSSVNDLVNPPNAELHSKTYYQVITGNDADIWVTIKQEKK